MRDADGTAAIYQGVTVTAGETVKSGQLVGYSGSIVGMAGRGVRARAVLRRRAVGGIFAAGGAESYGELFLHRRAAAHAEGRSAARSLEIL